jgi:hypothetical protein
MRKFGRSCNMSVHLQKAMVPEGWDDIGAWARWGKEIIEVGMEWVALTADMVGRRNVAKSSNGKQMPVKHHTGSSK